MNDAPYRPTPGNKPTTLLVLHSPTGKLFDLIKAEFEVGDSLTFDLSHIDAAEYDDLDSPQVVVATVLRRLQALRLLSQPHAKWSPRIIRDLALPLISGLKFVEAHAPPEAEELHRESSRMRKSLDELSVDLLSGPGPAQQFG